MSKNQTNFRPFVSANVPVGMPDIDNLVKGTGLKADKVRLLCHQLYLTTIKSAGWDVRANPWGKDGWAPLHHSLLKLILGNRYKQYLKLLIDKGYIQVFTSDDGKESYIRGKRCKRYRFTPATLVENKGRYFRREKVFDKTSVKAVHNARDKYLLYDAGNSAPLLDVHKSLISIAGDVVFDTKKAEEDLELLIRLGREKSTSLTEMQVRKKIEYLYLLNEESHATGTVSLFGERLFTPFTNLWSPLRKYMRFIDEPDQHLAIVDIVNSQPYFSSLLINKTVLEELLPEFSPLFPLYENLAEHDNSKLYHKLCSNGTLYEYWMAATALDRAGAKQDFFYVMFDRLGRRGMEAKKRRLRMDTNFPQVQQIFQVIKKSGEKSLPWLRELHVDKWGAFDEAYRYKNLACAMQRAESRLMLQRVAPELMRKGVKRFVTIHDCFIVNPNHIDVVKHTIRVEFECLGVRPPSLSVKLLNEC